MTLPGALRACTGGLCGSAGVIRSLPARLDISVVSSLRAFTKSAPRFYEKRWTGLCSGADSLAREPPGLCPRAFGSDLWAGNLSLL